MMGERHVQVKLFHSPPPLMQLYSSKGCHNNRLSVGAGFFPDDFGNRLRNSGQPPWGGVGVGSALALDIHYRSNSQF